MFFASFDCILKTAQGFYFSLIVRFYLYIYIYIYVLYYIYYIALYTKSSNLQNKNQKQNQLQMRFLKRSCGIYTRKINTYIHRYMCIYVNTY